MRKLYQILYNVGRLTDAPGGGRFLSRGDTLAVELFPFLGDTLAWAGLREGEALGVSEGRLPFSRSSPPGHAVVLRFGWCGVAGGVMDSAVLVVERCADSEVGGREGGPLAGLFPGWSIFVELYICFGNILWSR